MRQVEAHFDQLSSQYDDNFDGARAGKTFEFQTRQDLVTSLVREASGSLLDCACGTGQISAAALNAGRFSRAVMIDISDAMITRAKPRVTAVAPANLEFHCRDVFEYWPPDDEGFDVVLCLGLIAHTGQLPRLLVHLAAMLKPNGRIVLQTSVGDQIGVRIVRALSEDRQARRTGYRLSYFRMTDIFEAANCSGLSVRSVRRYCFGLPFGDSVFPRANYWIERLGVRLAQRVGAEAICLLSHVG